MMPFSKAPAASSGFCWPRRNAQGHLEAEPLFIVLINMEQTDLAWGSSPPRSWMGWEGGRARKTLAEGLSPFLGCCQSLSSAVPSQGD